jgi:O-antigen/teichoic acid export membrane protein
MNGAAYFGYALIAVSAVLLAIHVQSWQDWRQSGERRRREFVRLQLQRRFVASALIGVVGAAMTMIDRVPHTAAALSAYLFGLLMAGGVILAIALADVRATRQRHLVEQLDLLAEELRKAKSP